MLSLHEQPQSVALQRVASRHPDLTWHHELHGGLEVMGQVCRGAGTEQCHAKRSSSDTGGTVCAGMGAGPGTAYTGVGASWWQPLLGPGLGLESSYGGQEYYSYMYLYLSTQYHVFVLVFLLVFGVKISLVLVLRLEELDRYFYDYVHCVISDSSARKCCCLLALDRP